jgi:hypothetical protein
VAAPQRRAHLAQRLRARHLPPTQLDAHDYRGQRATTCSRTAASRASYLFWCDFNEAHGKPELFFIDPNNAADTYAATITISNVLADVDNALTFAPYEDASMERSTERHRLRRLPRLRQRRVYVRKDSRASSSAQDQRGADVHVNTAAKATRVATVFLNENDSESDRITCAIKVPAAQVNDVRHGQLIQVRFSHLPGYETAQIVRVLRKT